MSPKIFNSENSLGLNSGDKATFLNMFAHIALVAKINLPPTKIFQDYKDYINASLSKEVRKSCSNELSAFYYCKFIIFLDESKLEDGYNYFANELDVQSKNEFPSALGFLTYFSYQLNNFEKIGDYLNEFKNNLPLNPFLHTLLSYQFFHFYRGLYFVRRKVIK